MKIKKSDLLLIVISVLAGILWVGVEELKALSEESIIKESWSQNDFTSSSPGISFGSNLSLNLNYKNFTLLLTSSDGSEDTCQMPTCDPGGGFSSGEMNNVRVNGTGEAASLELITNASGGYGQFLNGNYISSIINFGQKVNLIQIRFEAENLLPNSSDYIPIHTPPDLLVSYGVNYEKFYPDNAGRTDTFNNTGQVGNNPPWNVDWGQGLDDFNANFTRAGKNWASSALGDIDGDGDLDVVIAQADSSTSSFTLIGYENKGSMGRPYWVPKEDWNETITGRGVRPQPALADLDGDGKAELIIGTNTQNILYLYEMSSGWVQWPWSCNDNSSEFILPDNPGKNLAPALADLDGDGDMDLLVGMGLHDGPGETGPGEGKVLVYINNSSDGCPLWERNSTWEITNITVWNPNNCWFCDCSQEADFTRPAVADLDGDGDMDVLVGHRHWSCGLVGDYDDDELIRAYENKGNGNWLPTSSWEPVHRVLNNRWYIANPALGDVTNQVLRFQINVSDEDGTWSGWIGPDGNSHTYFYPNHNYPDEGYYPSLPFNFTNIKALQYKAEFFTPDSSVSPRLDAVNITYEPQEKIIQSAISKALDNNYTLNQPNLWTRIDWSSSGGGEVKFKLRTGPTNNTSSWQEDWTGPGGDNSSYYTEPAYLPSGAPYRDSPFGNNRYLQYQVFLEANVSENNPPSLENLTFYYGQPEIELSQPSGIAGGGGIFYYNSSSNISITWNFSGFVPTDPVEVQCSQDGGNNYTTLKDATSIDTGLSGYPWDLSLQGEPFESEAVRIRVKGIDTGDFKDINATSADNFSVRHIYNYQVSANSTVTAGECWPLTITAQDINHNPVGKDYNVVLNLFNATFYSDGNCTLQINSTGLDASGEKTVYASSSQTGNLTIEVKDDKYNPQRAGEREGSTTVEVLPGEPDHLKFLQSFPSSWIVNKTIIPENQNTSQIEVELVDEFENPVSEVYEVKLFGSDDPVYFHDNEELSVMPSSVVNTSLGRAEFGSATYTVADEDPKYLCAEVVNSNIVNCTSEGITFLPEALSNVTPPSSPLGLVFLYPTSDTEEEKIEVFRFNITDAGEDNLPTRIDRINISVSGPAPGEDIAWAELSDNTTRLANASTITDTSITFGSFLPNGQGDLDEIEDGGEKEYSLYIYFKDSKLTATDGEVYTFSLNNSGVTVDPQMTSSSMDVDQNPVENTGMIKVIGNYSEVVTPEGESVINLTAGEPAPIIIRIVDENHNIDKEWDSWITFTLCGLTSAWDKDPDPTQEYEPYIENVHFTCNNDEWLTTYLDNGTSPLLNLTAYNSTGGYVEVGSDNLEGIYNLTVNVSPADPEWIEIEGENSSRAKAGSSLPITVRLYDDYGNPAGEDRPVYFNLTDWPEGALNQMIQPQTAFTNASGWAYSNLTLGDLQGAYNVTICGGYPQCNTNSVIFTGYASVPANISIITGDQEGIVNQSLEEAFVVKVEDEEGIGMAGEEVSFNIIEVPSGAQGYKFVENNQTTYSNFTDSNGEARATLKLGTKAGDYRVLISSGDLTPQTITASARPASPDHFLLSGPESIRAGNISSAIKLRVEDEFGNNATVSQDTLFNLTTTSSEGFFYSDAQGQNQISQITMENNTFQVVFYYNDSQTGSPGLEADWSSGESSLQGLSANLTLQVLPADLGELGVSGDTTEMIAGSSRLITITAYDEEGNIKSDYNDTVNVIFSGAHISPEPYSYQPVCIGEGGNISFGQPVELGFNQGEAQVNITLYKSENVTIKASIGDISTPDEKALEFTVNPAEAKRLRFSEPVADQTAGVEFELPSLEVIDEFGNLVGNYSGSMNVTYVLSGEENSPNGEYTDSYTSPVEFSGGSSVTSLKTTLYRAQDTTLTPDGEDLEQGEESNLFHVSSGEVDHLTFYQQPSAFAFTNFPFEVQPQVAVADRYGNPCENENNITISLSSEPVEEGGSLQGELRGTLRKTTEAGLAVFEGLYYTYPESLRLEATASIDGNEISVSSQPIQVHCGSDTQITLVDSGVTSIPSTADSSSEKQEVFSFKITDAGSDGYPTRITRINITRDVSNDTTGGWQNYIAGATLSDGSHTEFAAPGDDAITFGQGQSIIFSVPEGGEKTFTLSIYLKDTLVEPDGKVIGFKIDANDDIEIEDESSGEPGSKFAEVEPISDTVKIDVEPTNFILSIEGNITQVEAGSTHTIYLTATDEKGNVDKDYEDTRTIIFEGANPSSKGNKPTCKNYQNDNITFGQDTYLVFSQGTSSTSMTLYKAETVAIKAKDNTGDDYSPLTSDEDALVLAVIGREASELSWAEEPQGPVVKKAPWLPFKVAVVDEYGNQASGSLNITVEAKDVPYGNDVEVAGAEVQASSGSATFSNFYVVECPGGGNNCKIKLTGTASGVNSTEEVGPIWVNETYQVTITARDYTTAGTLSDVELELKDSAGNPITLTRNLNPFEAELPYGEDYSLTFTKEQYVPLTLNKNADENADLSTDGVLDNKISWEAFVMSIAEATSDYHVISSVIYDEDEDQLTVRLWLERRGKRVKDDEFSTLDETAILEVYDSEDVTGQPLYNLSISPLDRSQGIYSRTFSGVVEEGGDIDLEAGKTYFGIGKVTITNPDYGSRQYQSGTSFTISVTKKLKETTEEIKAIAEEIRDKVQTEAASIREKIESKSEEIKSKITAEAEETQAKVEEVKSQAENILVATQEELPKKITSMREELTTTLREEVEPHIRSSILNRETTVRSGDTLIVRYRTYPGLSPTIDVYNPKNRLVVNKQPMVETEEGIYTYELEFKRNWGRGDFTIVCSEPTRGTVDALIITVVAHDIEEVAGQVASILGTTATLSDLAELSSSLNTQFRLLESALEKVSQDMASQMAGSSSNLETIYNQLVNLSRQVKRLNSSQGIDLKRVYEVSEERKNDLVYIKNKTQELKAAMEVSQKMLENVAKKPIVQSWFEFK